MSELATGATRQRWHNYLIETPTYGTYLERTPEYEVVTTMLSTLGLKDDDLIVDVGAGSCDMDHYLRTAAGWRGKYLPIDGATHGIDFNVKHPYEYLPSSKADFYVCIETLEHLYNPETLVKFMQMRATRGIVVSTPNAESVDVIAVDSTHVYPIYPHDLEGWGFTVLKYNFCGRGTEEEPDTLIGIWNPNQVNEDFMPV